MSRGIRRLTRDEKVEEDNASDDGRPDIDPNIDLIGELAYGKLLLEVHDVFWIRLSSGAAMVGGGKREKIRKTERKADRKHSSEQKVTDKWKRCRGKEAKNEASSSKSWKKTKTFDLGCGFWSVFCCCCLSKPSGGRQRG